MLTRETPYPRSKSVRQLRALACILAAVSLGACASAGRPDLAASPAASRVVVRNYSLNRVAVYLGRGGSLWRLGDVEAVSDGSFQVPQPLTYPDNVHLVARPLGGRPFRSESFVFPTGTTAVWTIENQVAMSRLMLR